MSSDDKAMKAFDVAIDVAKQLLTLATAVITVTITFSKDILGGATNGRMTLLAVAWLFFFISILGGVWFLYAASGSISEMNNTPRKIYDLNTAIPMGIQQVCFVIGLALTGIFGIMAI
jgi:hypothetical protein